MDGSPNTGLFDLHGRITLLTGSRRGLGFALARGMGQAGARIVLNARDGALLDEAVKSLRGEGLDVSRCAFDVSDGQAVEDGVRQIEDEVGPIDVLVNNAGIQRRGELASLSESDWREVLATNLTGPFLIAQRVAQGMIDRREGKIINICSVMSELGRRTTGNYAASKGGLKMLTRAMAVEWAEHNVQVNAIGPGYFLTDMTRPLAEDAKFDAWLKAHPGKALGKPEELIGAAVFLASRASDFVNGQVLYVDGGILAAL